MQLVLKKPPRLSVVYEGQTYELSKPTLGDSVEFEILLEEAKVSGKKSVELMVSFLEARGLPRAASLTMEGELIQEVVDALMPKKKA